MLDITNLPQKSPDYDLAELLEAGMHFGHQSAKWHPKMKDYIYMEKDGVHIFDLAQTAAALKQAYNAAYALGKSGKSLVIVGTKRQAKESVEEIAAEAKVPYINSRWLGGLLTNWEQVNKSLKKMLKIEQGLKEGAYDNYTKYERLQLEKEGGKLERFFDGIRSLKGKPDALFIIDPNREKNAVKEAENTGVFTIGLVDSNCDPDSVQLVIPSNDDGRRAIEYALKVVVAGYNAGKNE